MAEEHDGSQKTEAPSQRRLQEARERGQVVASREVATALSFVAAALACAASASQAAQTVVTVGRVFLAEAAARGIDQGWLGPFLREAVIHVGAALALPALACAAAPVLGAVLQNAVVWTAEPLRPKLERISPLAGAKRLLSLRALLELVKSLAKIGLVGTALLLLLWPERGAILAAGRLEPGPFAAYLANLPLEVLAVAALVAALIAAADYGQQWLAFMRQMRMSRRELQDELKQSEGDPHTRQRLKSLRLERTRRRMMAELPKATVVIANPTHVAVALRYVGGETPAPKVLAKGVDALALRIRAAAEAHGIPVVENPPLARALHTACGIGEFIPPAHYQAVAEIVSYVMRLNDERHP
ncbi:EscU/YscU/HrcU family type III secretion system export apparatus switch protein [Benzoatithermus flavus]|uniref:EscU/YscU/HrcU family type III secretion system export apparatus switch protein n=1 Tax=Benzoatithermus flavus TaxID=3108223 RepID=A0ABU8XYK6_9PROT